MKKEKWKKVGKAVANIGLPLLATAVTGGSAGVISAIAGALKLKNSDPETVLKALESGDTETAVRLAEIEASHKEELERIALSYTQLEISLAIAVNETMREEATSEKWWVSGWRPFNGFLFGVSLVCIYFILPLLELPTPSIPAEVWLMWGAILGAASWDRGKEKRVKAGDKYESIFKRGDK